MLSSHRNRDGTRGQILALFAIGASVLILVIGLVVDGGGALVERRESQNTSDFASLAGARIVAQWIDENANNAGVHVNGLDANVQAAINASINAHGATPVTYGAPNGPYYVSEAGANLGYVGTGAIPANTVGVSVSTNRSYRPYFLGAIGVGSWTVSSAATARGGFSDGPPAGNIFPAGISLAFFETYPFCDGPVNSSPQCTPQELTPGNTNVPGGFGWLKFGCDGYGLGQEPPANIGGCQNNRPFLQEEIGPPGKSFGCCTDVGLPGSPDFIGSLPGNKVSADCSYYIDNEITVTVPIWDYADGNGENAYYHIIGFAGFQITECRGGKNISGVWRKLFSVGPVSSTSDGPFDQLGVQLIR
jgi:Flp pilus assembly protein TadG